VTEAPSRLENLRTLRVTYMDVGFATAFVSLTTGAFLVGFIQLLGGSDLWIGLLSAIPSLAGLVQVPSAVWGRRYPSFKRFVTPGGWVWRILHLPLVALPLLPWPDHVRLIVLAVCVTIAGISIAIVNPIYSDWIAEMVPPDSRGYYFARRNAISAAVGAVAGLVGATALDYFRGRQMDATGFATVFGFGILCALVSMAFYLRMTDIPRRNPVQQSVGDGLRSIARPFRDGAYRKVLIFLGLAVMGQTFAGNLFAAFARETLDLNFKVIQGTAVFMAIGNLAAAGFWGFLADKYGNKPVLTLGLILMATNPIAWLLCRPGADTFNSVLLLGSHVIMGVIWACVALAQFNIILATAPVDERPSYLAAGMAVTAVMGGVAPLLGAATMAELRHHLPAETAYKIVFGSCIFLRLLSAGFLATVHEPGAAGFRSTVRQLRNVTPRRMRAMRSLTHTGDSATRESAIADIGATGMSLAADEILRALHDPLPRVRRQAASAIALLRDPRAVEELLHQLDEHPDLVEEETVEALGQLGDPRALPALEVLLASPRSILRRAAARAIGKIAPRGAPVGLLAAASDSGDPDLRRAALQAIRTIGDRTAAPTILAALEDEHPSVRIAAAEAVAELELFEAREALRTSLTHFADEASAEVAYALGAVGTDDDLPELLAMARACRSMITRRRILLGVARILGVEREAYRLMLQSGMERDRSLMEALRPLGAVGNQSLDRFSAGDEGAAIALLCPRNPRLKPLADSPVDEAFLIAAVAAR